MRTSPDRERSLWDERRWSTTFSVSLLVILTILFIVPFANKAFHIDDPLFLWAARQIQSHPADPYGFKLTWYFNQMEMWQVTKNPPLACYYIALVASLLGWSETTLHLAFLIPAVAAVLGTFFLARKFCVKPTLACLAGLMTPVFIVSSTTIMCDTMMLAFWVWAVFLWIRGIERADWVPVGGSAFLIALCALTKYYGMSLLLLLPLYAVAKNRKIGLWVAYLAIPILLLALYQWGTHVLYGRGLLSDAGAYASEFRGRLAMGLSTKGFIGLAFTGGCLVSLLFYLPFLWPRNVCLIQLALTTGAILGISSIKMIGVFPLHNAYGAKWSQVIQLGIMVVLGMNFLVIALVDLWDHKGDAASLLLFFWVLGTFTFASFINWGVNARSMLPMVPAMGILLARRLEKRAFSFEEPSMLLWPLVPAALISLLVAWADYGLANSARDAAEKIHSFHSKEQGTLWFQGHWGFQYYMELKGAKIAEWNTFRPGTGDRLVIPENNCYTFPIPLDKTANLQETLEFVPSCDWLTTMNRFEGAGFYSDIWGPLPFVTSPTLPERYHLLQLEPARHGSGPPGVSGKDREEYEKAIADHTRALLPNIYDPEAFYNRAKVFIKGGEYDRAISDYTQGLTIDPYDAEVYTLRGNAFFMKGEYEKAVSDYTQALRLDRLLLKVYSNRATAYRTQGKFEKAISDYTHALGIDPGYARAYLNRGNTYVLIGQYDQAISDFSQALRITPDDTVAYQNRAFAHFKKGEFDKAWRDIEKAQRLGANVNPALLEQLRKFSGRQQ